MVERASADSGLIAHTLTRIPDEPRWVDTRGMLLSGRAFVRPSDGDAPQFSAIVVVSDSALVSIVGRPPARAISDAVATLSGDLNVLAQMDDADYVGDALDGWRRRRAIIHVLPGVTAWEAHTEPHTRVFTRASAPRFDHVPEQLRRELRDALNGRTVSRFVPGVVPPSSARIGRLKVPMTAVWADGRPVSFCYPVWQTEAWWDVSIETLAGYRRRGFAARGARTMIRYMRSTGRAPVWGALESNSASRALAARLGFVEAAGIAVFTAM